MTMRTFFSIALIGLFTSLSAQETLNYPFNPDGNSDGTIAAPDLLDVLVVYGNSFTPAQIMVTQCLYSGWCIPINLSPGPAIEVFNEPLPEGYQYLENQSCAASIISNDPYCVNNQWDFYCENTYSSCVNNSSCEMGLSAYLSSLENRMSQMEDLIESQALIIDALQSAGVDGLANYLSVDEVTNTVLISGANLQVVSGEESTDASVNGKGNIIIGYDENNGDDKSGSHNLVVGSEHTYSSYGGIVVGSNNSITGEYSSVSGGAGNIANGFSSSVSGGWVNSALHNYSSVLGGNFNTASGSVSSVSGGKDNTASGSWSSVSGGEYNTASGILSSVSGGASNTASGYSSSVSGDNSYEDWVEAQGFLTEETDPIANAAGYATEPWVINQGYSTGGTGGVDGLENYLSVDESTNTILISGANLQVVSGEESTDASVNGKGNIIIGYDENNGDDKSGSHNLVVGSQHTYSSYGGLVVGHNNSITGVYSSVSGGTYNTASGAYSSVSGGGQIMALGSYSSCVGNRSNTFLDNSDEGFPLIW